MFYPNSIAPRSFSYYVLLWIYVFHITFLQSNEASIERKFTVRSCRDNNCSKALDLCIQDRCNTVSQCQYCIDRYNPECTDCSNDIFNEKPEIIDDREVYVCDIEDDVQVVACRYFCRGKFRSNGECVPYSNNLDVCDCSAIPVTATSNPTTKPTSPTPSYPRGTLIRTIGPHRGDIWCLELLANGFVAAGDTKGEIRIWNPNNGERIRTLESHTEEVIALKLLSNGNLVSSSNDFKIIIWDVSNGNIVRSIVNTFVTSALETLLDETLVAGGVDGNIRLFRSDLSLISTFNAHGAYIQALILLPNGNLASGSYDFSVRIWDTAKKFELISRSFHRNAVTDIDLIHDGNLASGGWDRAVRIWDSNNGNPIRNISNALNAEIYSIRYLDNNYLGVAGRNSNQIRIYSTIDWSLNLTLRIDTFPSISSLELLSNGNLISGQSDGLLRVWQL